MLDKFKCVNCVVPLQMLFLAEKDQWLLVKQRHQTISASLGWAVKNVVGVSGTYI